MDSPAAGSAARGVGATLELRSGRGGKSATVRLLLWPLARRILQGPGNGEGGRGGRVRVLSLITLWIGVCLILYSGVYRLLIHLDGVGIIGELLALRLLGLILLAFFSALLFSNLLTAIQVFFLAGDLEYLLTAPVSAFRFYLARALETALHSSWLVLLLLLPILFAYGIVYDGGWAYPLVVTATLAGYFTMPAILGVAAALLLVNLCSARRARELMAISGLMGGALSVGLARYLRPERLGGAGVVEGLGGILDGLSALRSEWLPSEWAAAAIVAPLRLGGSSLGPLLTLAGTTVLVLVAGCSLHLLLYDRAFSRNVGAGSRVKGSGRRRRLPRSPLDHMPLLVRTMIVKELRTTLRDRAWWTELALLTLLVVVYIYNIGVLPIGGGTGAGPVLAESISFLSLGFAGPVLAVVATRLVLPTFGRESGALWLWRTAPIDPGVLVWTNYLMGLAPLMVVGVALVAGTNLVLGVGPYMAVLSMTTILSVVPAIAGLAMAYGVAFPVTDPRGGRSPTGFGALSFMATSILYLIMVMGIEAWPILMVLQARVSGESPGTLVQLGGVGALMVVVALSFVVTMISLRSALERVRSVGQGQGQGSPLSGKSGRNGGGRGMIPTTESAGH